MSHVLELPDPLFAALEQAAEKSGTTPLGWIAAHLPEAKIDGAREGQRHPRTMAELFAGRLGRVRSGGGERLSEDCGERLTDGLEEKRRAGRL